MKTRRTIKGTSVEGVVEEAYTPSNPPPYPVTSVAGRTGAVTLSKTDVGLSNVDNVKQYSSSNPPPYPVTSVAGLTGAVSTSELASRFTNYNAPNLIASSQSIDVDFRSDSQSSGALTLKVDGGLRGIFNITIFNETENWIFGGSFIDLTMIFASADTSTKVLVTTDVDWVTFTYESSGEEARLRITDAYGKSRGHRYHAWIGYI